MYIRSGFAALTFDGRWTMTTSSRSQSALVLVLTIFSYASYLQAQTTTLEPPATTTTTTANNQSNSTGPIINDNNAGQSARYLDLWYVPLIIVFVVLFFMIAFIVIRNTLLTNERIHNSKFYKGVMRRLETRKEKATDRKSMKKNQASVKKQPAQENPGAEQFSNLRQTSNLSPPPPTAAGITKNETFDPAYPATQSGSRVNKAYSFQDDDLVEIGRF